MRVYVFWCVCVCFVGVCVLGVFWHVFWGICFRGVCFGRVFWGVCVCMCVFVFVFVDVLWYTRRGQFSPSTL